MGLLGFKPPIELDGLRASLLFHERMLESVAHIWMRNLIVEAFETLG